MKVTLLMPTLNEIDGMKQIMPLIKPEWCDQIVVSDGGSTDGTVEYAKAHGYTVVRQDKPGLINALRDGFKVSTGDVIITFSPDGNSLPELIPALIAKMKEGHDLVIVSRYRDGARSDDDSLITRFGNWMFTTMINVFFGGHYTDTLVIFRAYKRETVTRCHLMTDTFFSPERKFPKYAGWDVNSSIRAAKLKLKVAEIPGSEPERIGGVTKCMRIRNGLVILGEIFYDLVFWKVTPDTVETPRVSSAL